MKINLNLIPLLGLAQSSANTHQKFKDQDFKPLSNINLATLTSSQGFWLQGINTNDYTGSSVSNAGDVNGDGYSDMIIGASGYSSYAGRAYVIYGGPALASINLGSLTSSQGFTVDGINTNDETGVSVSSAGDINNDGYYDVMISASGYSSYAGRTYIIYGGSSLQNINLASLTSSQGFLVQGANSNDHLGFSVSSAGDLNNDGYDDMIIGAYGYSSGAGRTYIIYGGSSLQNINLASLTSSQGFWVQGINSYDNTGSSVSSAGDINNDGYADIVIGAPSYNLDNRYTGRAYVIYGGSSLQNINLASLTSSQGFWVQGINTYDRTGSSVSSAGDINKDGYSDMIIGAYGCSSYAGRAYVIYGGPALASINLASLTSSQGFWLQGINTNDYTGGSVSSAGDINKDGYDDMIIGADGYSSGAGRVYVIYGGATINPTLAPITNPSSGPTAKPTFAPSTSPSSGSTLGPTAKPTFAPTQILTPAPTSPTQMPTPPPSTSPSSLPTLGPTTSPTFAPSQYFLVTCNSGQITCFGTSLNDHFFIKTQNNVLVTGGAGNDLFSIYKNTNSNSIIITDFNLNGEIDLIDLSDFSYSFADLSTKYNRITNDVTIFLPDGQTIILQNQNSDVTKADFTGLVAASPTLAPVTSSRETGLSGAIIGLISGGSGGVAIVGLVVACSKSLCIRAFDKWHHRIPEALPGFNFVNMILYPCSLMYKKAYVDELFLREAIKLQKQDINNEKEINNNKDFPDIWLMHDIKFDNPLLNDIYHSKYSKSESISLLRDFNQNSVSQNIVSQNSGMSES
ncbi:MAG: FG-GAP-like repeat-containing protein, partial [Rickettsiaceae bacterium]|nr:FG-GAP-like repeat-containing protein [Rickettsiaceae bacterium]